MKYILLIVTIFTASVSFASVCKIIDRTICSPRGSGCCSRPPCPRNQGTQTYMGLTFTQCKAKITKGEALGRCTVDGMKVKMQYIYEAAVTSNSGVYTYTPSACEAILSEVQITRDPIPEASPRTR